MPPYGGELPWASEHLQFADTLHPSDLKLWQPWADKEESPWNSAQSAAPAPDFCCNSCAASDIEVRCRGCGVTSDLKMAPSIVRPVLSSYQQVAKEEQPTTPSLDSSPSSRADSFASTLNSTHSTSETPGTEVDPLDIAEHDFATHSKKPARRQAGLWAPSTGAEGSNSRSSSYARVSQRTSLWDPEAEASSSTHNAFAPVRPAISPSDLTFAPASTSSYAFEPSSSSYDAFKPVRPSVAEWDPAEGSSKSHEAIETIASSSKAPIHTPSSAPPLAPAPIASIQQSRTSTQPSKPWFDAAHSKPLTFKFVLTPRKKAYKPPECDEDGHIITSSPTSSLTTHSTPSEGSSKPPPTTPMFSSAPTLAEIAEDPSALQRLLVCTMFLMNKVPDKNAGPKRLDLDVLSGRGKRSGYAMKHEDRVVHEKMSLDAGLERTQWKISFSRNT
ncbi:hypothetical protein BT63DRAFT_476765 [Microthyrium microscopicum]|uniref:Uncharacterized protein n=1 Tax=Microthyrium microscopicum TaxID=703497 RepID=A0A6A6ULZ5_9PEZI|nr:hypothetical protein BT63DRAFT_476765 [Microthyrium microscopicum]